MGPNTRFLEYRTRERQRDYAATSFVLGWSVSFFGYHKTEKTSLSSFQLRQTLFLYLSYIAVRYGVLPIFSTYSAKHAMPAFFTPFNVAMLVNVTFIVLWAIGLIGGQQRRRKSNPLFEAVPHNLFLRSYLKRT